jgi:hypothetical protein
LICRGSKVGLYCEKVTKRAQQQAAETLREIYAEIKAVERRKRRAVDIEDYDTAKTYKEAIVELRSTKEALTKEAGDNALFRVIDADDKYFRLEPKHSPGKFLCSSGKDDGDGELLSLVDEKTDSSLFETVGVKGDNFRLSLKTSPGKYVACFGKQGCQQAVLRQEENDSSLFKITSVRHPRVMVSDSFVADIFTQSKKFNPLETALEDTWDLPAVSSPTSRAGSPANKLMRTGTGTSSNNKTMSTTGSSTMKQSFAWTSTGTSLSPQHDRDVSNWQATIDMKEQLLVSQNLQIAAYQRALDEQMTVTCESKHSYQAHSSTLWPVQIVDAEQIAIRFDPHCSVEDGDAVFLFGNAAPARGCGPNQLTHNDYSRQGKSRSRQESGSQVLGYFSGRSHWPGVGGEPPLIVNSDSFHVSFVTGPCKEPSATKPWGFKLMATACTMKKIQVGDDGTFERLDGVCIPAPSQLSQYEQKAKEAMEARDDKRADATQLELQYTSTKAELDRVANNHKRELFAAAAARKAFAVAAFVAASAATAAFASTRRMQAAKAFRMSELHAVELAIIKELKAKAVANVQTQNVLASMVESAPRAHKARVNLGSFVPCAKVALVSVPGAVARSQSTRVAIFPTSTFEVSVGREEDEAKAFGHVVREPSQFDLGKDEEKREWKDGIAPMLKSGTSYTVKLDSGAEAVVDGRDIRYSGAPQYEFWHAVTKLHAAADRKKMQVRQINYDTKGKNKGRVYTWSRPTDAELAAFVEDATGAGNWGKADEEFEVTYDGGTSVVRVPRGELAAHSRLAFSCVWFPNRDSNHTGCCTMEARLEEMAEEEGYERYNHTTDGSSIKNAQWVHDELAKAYRANKHGAGKAVKVVSGDYVGEHGVLAECVTPKQRLKAQTAYQVRLAGAEEDVSIYGLDMEVVPLPTCAHCAWFDPWQSTARRCSDDLQSLRFAFLDYPLSPQQPTFYCKADGKNYFVGHAQRVELTWAQDVIGLVVEPITVADTVDSMLADWVKEQATDLLQRLKANSEEAFNFKDQPKFFGYRVSEEEMAADAGGELAAIQELVAKAEEAWNCAKVHTQAESLQEEILALRALTTALEVEACAELREAKIRSGLEDNVAELEKKAADLEKKVLDSKAEAKKMKAVEKELQKDNNDMACTLSQHKEEGEAHLVAQKTVVSKRVRKEYEKKVRALQQQVEELTAKEQARAEQAAAAHEKAARANGRPSAAVTKQPTSPKKPPPLRQRRQGGKEEPEEDTEEVLRRLKIENRQQAKVT